VGSTKSRLPVVLLALEAVIIEPMSAIMRRALLVWVCYVVDRRCLPQYAVLFSQRGFAGWRACLYVCTGLLEVQTLLEKYPLAAYLLYRVQLRFIVLLAGQRSRVR
jgi:hypothetical protein